MKKILLPLIAGSVAIGSAHAVDLRQYVSLKVADVVSGNMNIDYDDGIFTFNENHKAKEFFGGSLAYGVKLSDFRVELEANIYSKAKFRGMGALGVNNTSLFVNAYYDLRTNSPFVPYVGAGLGYNRINISEPGYDDTDASLGIKANIGVLWEINDMFGLDIGYRYNHFGTFSDPDVDVEISGHELALGARISF